MLELGESFEDGVRCEVAEEAGFRVSVDGLTGVYKNMNRGVVALVFRCSPLDEHQHATDNEATSVRWIDPTEALELMDPAYAVRVSDSLSDSAPVTRAHDGVRLIGA